MTQLINDFVLHIATVNGSGSQSANNVLVRTLFRMGIPVGGKNLFPSNIQGLPTWFTIRANPKGFVSRRAWHDVVITLNPSTAKPDQRDLRVGGLFLYSTDCKLAEGDLRKDVLALAVPFRDLVANASESVKARKLLQNIAYVGIMAQVLGLPLDTIEKVIDDQLGHKQDLVRANMLALRAGFDWSLSQESLKQVQLSAQPVANGAEGKVLIDGNSAAALGLVFGGCSFASWYPITPSSSVMESFLSYAQQFRRDQENKNCFSVVQAEDELSAISMAIGAGWAGARAATATSGPGLSLMAEAAGLAYFAEIPAVIWDVQRVGPSTGLPTRTMQGDVLFAAKLSHGDTQHVLLFPGGPEESFEFGRTALDLAEQLQTLVIVLSDLDQGMNFHIAKDFQYSSAPLKRGKVLSSQDLERVGQFARYKDVDGDGICYRTLPLTRHPLAGYFTRGTGHNEAAGYSEDPQVFKAKMDRLKLKWKTARDLVPRPEIQIAPLGLAKQKKCGVVYYGSTHSAWPEAAEILSEKNLSFSSLRLRAYPFNSEVVKFITDHDHVFVIEQNRDAQMRTLLAEDCPELAGRLHSILFYDGLPVCAEILARALEKNCESLELLTHNFSTKNGEL